MAITAGAKKAIRVSKRKRVFNLRRKATIDNELKAFRKAVTAKDKATASKLISSVYQSLDKAVKTGYIKANTSARLKSRAMKALAKIA